MWYDLHGRHDLPWQSDNAYYVWLSEVMLQQTQVKTVIPYFNNFIKHFPSVEALAQASLDDVLANWAGLGYYTRARNLHKAAVEINLHWNKNFSKNPDDWLALSGIGRSTAAAIVSQSFDIPLAILDGNVKRVLSRYYAIEGWTGNKKIENILWLKAEQLIPKEKGANYTQAIMDLGATVCKRNKPLCTTCPVQLDCEAYQLDKTKELPTRKPKKVLPKQERFFALILKGKTLLMVKRPPVGIWGGLWSLPEFETETQCLKFIEKNNFALQKDLCSVDPLLHKFSHYELQLKPLVLNVSKNKQAQSVNELDEVTWFELDNIPKGIATPINKLINRCIK